MEEDKDVELEVEQLDIAPSAKYLLCRKEDKYFCLSIKAKDNDLFVCESIKNASLCFYEECIFENSMWYEERGFVKLQFFNWLKEESFVNRIYFNRIL